MNKVKACDLKVGDRIYLESGFHTVKSIEEFGVIGRIRITFIIDSTFKTDYKVITVERSKFFTENIIG